MSTANATTSAAAGSLVLVSGWAHPAAVIEPLAVGLRGVCAQTRLLSLHDLPAADPAAALAEICVSLPPPLYLLGWSTGAMVVLETALRNPQIPARLVLLSACARFCNTEGYGCATPPAALRLLQRGLRRQPETALAAFFADSAKPATAAGDELAGSVAAALKPGIAGLLAGLDYLERTDLRPGLATFRLPSLVVHGAADCIVPAAAGVFLAASLPAGHLVTLPEHGHALPGHAAELAGTIKDFLHARH